MTARLPENIALTMRRLLDGEASSTPEAAAYLADELRAWVQDPAGYVPREVLAELTRAVWVKYKYAMTEEDRERFRRATSAPGPAWFVLADFDRMTDEERGNCYLWCRQVMEDMAVGETRHYIEQLNDAIARGLGVPPPASSPLVSAPSRSPASPSTSPSG